MRIVGERHFRECCGSSWATAVGWSDVDLAGLRNQQSPALSNSARLIRHTLHSRSHIAFCFGCRDSGVIGAGEGDSICLAAFNCPQSRTNGGQSRVTHIKAGIEEIDWNTRHARRKKEKQEFKVGGLLLMYAGVETQAPWNATSTASHFHCTRLITTIH